MPVLSATLPVLYSEPLPEERTARLREELRRVQRSAHGGEYTLFYRLFGIAGEWWLHPVNYFNTDSKAPKHKGRKGPFVVSEKIEQKYGEPYQKGPEQTFDSEADAWAWVVAEHARRVDERFVELAQNKRHDAVAHRDSLEAKLLAAEATVAAWNALLNGR